MLTIEVVSTLPRLSALKTEWNALADRFPTPLVRHEWFEACAIAFAERSDLAVFVARDAGVVRAIAPLAIDRSGALARLTYLGHQTTEPEAFLADDRRALAAVCKAARAAGLPIVLKRLGADSDEMRLLSDPQRRKGVVVPRPLSTRSAFAPLGDWKAFEAAMSGGSRTDVRRKRKGLEREGKVTFEAAAPDETTLDRYLDELFSVEAAGWKSRAGTAIIQDERMTRFYTEYGRVAARLGTLRLFFLRVGGESAAAQMHVEYAGRLWSLKIGYDERWAKFSPGRLLTHEVMRHGCERRLEALEFLGVAELWQQRWPVEIRQHSTFRSYPASPRGGVALAIDSLNFVGRRVSGEARRDNARFIPPPQAKRGAA